MLAKIGSWAVMGTLAIVLSACGGGDAEGGAAMEAAAYNGVGTPGVDGAPMGYGALAAQGLPGASSALSIEANGQVMTMHGGGAYVVTNTVPKEDGAVPGSGTGTLATGATTTELDAGLQEKMLMSELAYEKSFSLEMNRRYAEYKERVGIVEPVVQQAYVPHPECADPSGTACGGGQMLAQQ